MPGIDLAANLRVLLDYQPDENIQHFFRSLGVLELHLIVSGKCCAYLLEEIPQIGL